jgi:hypothetical protein
MIKGVTYSILTLLFIFSLGNLSSAGLNAESEYSLIVVKDKPELYCGLALPVDGGEGGEGDETGGTEEEPQDGSESEPDSGSQTGR